MVCGAGRELSLVAVELVPRPVTKAQSYAIKSMLCDKCVTRATDIMCKMSAQDQFDTELTCLLRRAGHGLLLGEVIRCIGCGMSTVVSLLRTSKQFVLQDSTRGRGESVQVVNFAVKEHECDSPLRLMNNPLNISMYPNPVDFPGVDHVFRADGVQDSLDDFAKHWLPSELYDAIGER